MILLVTGPTEARAAIESVDIGYPWGEPACDLSGQCAWGLRCSDDSSSLRAELESAHEGVVTLVLTDDLDWRTQLGWQTAPPEGELPPPIVP